MSIKNRTLKMYSITLIDSKGAQLPPENIMNYFASLNLRHKIEIKFDDISTERIHYLHEFKKGNDYGLGYFKSAKYNHAPDLIDKETLLERLNPKKPTEGDGEKTHFGFRMDSSGVIFMLETKNNGISIGKIIYYLNKFRKGRIDPSYEFSYQIYAKEDFLKKLRNMNRAMTVEVVTSKKYATDTFMNDLLQDSSTKEEFNVEIKAKKGQSLAKKAIEKIYDGFLHHKGEEIKRIKIIGYGQQNQFDIIDTERLIDRKYAEVELDSNGQVITDSMYKNLKIHLGI